MTTKAQTRTEGAIYIAFLLLAVLVLPYFATLGFRWAFSSLPIYVSCLVVGMSLAVWASYKITPNWAGRLVLMAVGLGVFGAFLALPLKYNHYQQPTRPAPGYQLQWVTQPTTTLDDAFKQFQYTSEIGCDFSLLGWTEMGSLQYTSACQPGVWTYSPATQTSTWALFNFDTPSKAVTRWNNAHYLTQPTGLIEDQAAFLTLERATAPNGQWEAVVVRWFYGPSDVVLVSVK